MINHKAMLAESVYPPHKSY